MKRNIFKKLLTICILLWSMFFLLIPNLVFATTKIGDPCKLDSDCTDIKDAKCDTAKKICALPPTPTLTPGTITSEDVPFVPTEPKLNINIPTVQFSKIKKEGQFINVSILAEYVSGVYKYAVAIVSVIAIIMVMAGGFVYLTSGGNTSRVGKAKDMITGSSIGLILTLGSYLVLYTINPNLVSFDALKLKLISREVYIMGEYQDGAETAFPASTSPPSFKDCPIPSLKDIKEDFKKPGGGPRTLAFNKAIASYITGTIDQKITTAAETVVKCKAYYGHCGKTAKAIWKLAGKNMSYTKNIYNFVPKKLAELRPCYLAPPANKKWYTAAELKANKACKKKIKFNGPENLAARKKVYEYAKKEIGGGWPESWLKVLKPGCYLIVFNANTVDRYGTHSTTFLGWKSNGLATVVNGSANRYAWKGSMCLSQACGAKVQPVLRVKCP